MEERRLIMNGKRKDILTLGVVLFLALKWALPQPIMARDGRPGGRRGSPAARGRGSSGRHRSTFRSRLGRRHSRWNRGSRYGSRLGISFGFSSRSYYTSSRRWVPGYYNTYTRQVLVEPGHYEWQTQRVQVEPGRYEIRNIPAVEETRYDKEGKAYKVVVQLAQTETVWIEPTYEEHKVKVYVPDRYESREVSVWVPGRWVTYSSYSSGKPSIRIGGVFRF